MTDRESFIAGILAHPDDDARRLQFADWLGENGEPEREEFVRVQIALTRIQPGPCCDGNGFASRAAAIFPCDCEWAQLRRREWELMPPTTLHWQVNARISKKEMYAARGGEQVQPYARDVLRQAGFDLNRPFDHHSDEMTNSFIYTQELFHAPVEYRRGFVEHITLSWQDWSQRAEAILSEHPIREVTLREPNELTQELATMFGAANVLADLHDRWPSIKFNLTETPQTDWTQAAGQHAEELIRSNAGDLGVQIEPDQNFRQIPFPANWDRPFLESICCRDRPPLRTIANLGHVPVPNYQTVELRSHRFASRSPGGIRTVQTLYVGQCTACRTILFAESHPQYLAQNEVHIPYPRTMGVLRSE